MESPHRHSISGPRTRAHVCAHYAPARAFCDRTENGWQVDRLTKWHPTRPLPRSHEHHQFHQFRSVPDQFRPSRTDEAMCIRAHKRPYAHSVHVISSLVPFLKGGTDECTPKWQKIVACPAKK
jgi:hypothetical protein